MEQAVILYLFLINVAGITVMYADKLRAVRQDWRVPEKVLFAVSIAGGSMGTWAGMYLFRHKTKQKRFVIGIPLILCIQILVAVLSNIF